MRAEWLQTAMFEITNINSRPIGIVSGSDPEHPTADTKKFFLPLYRLSNGNSATETLKFSTTRVVVNRQPNLHSSRVCWDKAGATRGNEEEYLPRNGKKYWSTKTLTLQIHCPIISVIRQIYTWILWLCAFNRSPITDLNYENLSVRKWRKGSCEFIKLLCPASKIATNFQENYQLPMVNKCIWLRLQHLNVLVFSSTRWRMKNSVK